MHPGFWRVVFSSRDTLRRKRRNSRASVQAPVVAVPRVLLQSIFSVLFPSDCRICSTPLDNISRVPVCAECLAEIKPLRAPQCLVCGDRLMSAQLLMGDGLCVNCRQRRPEFERAVSFAEYRDGLRRLIHLLKYESVMPVQAPLGRMLAEAVAELLPTSDGKVVLLPVPLHRSRRRSRGFNQAELIAKAAVKRLPALDFAPGVLVRQRETISQVGLSREERIENMRGAFRVADAGRVKGRTVIVVDDVMTTGTTLSECARVLKRAGAENVWAATVARAFHGADLAEAADDGEQGELEAAAVPASI
ncbi:MAG TPA: ComF family protein [Terriglobales bacterium]|nr:ComF family protein [Terriglobales bacterium]